jgi:hypothetical protein
MDCGAAFTRNMPNGLMDRLHGKTGASLITISLVIHIIALAKQALYG